MEVNIGFPYVKVHVDSNNIKLSREPGQNMKVSLRDHLRICLEYV